MNDNEFYKFEQTYEQVTFKNFIDFFYKNPKAFKNGSLKLINLIYQQNNDDRSKFGSSYFNIEFISVSQQLVNISKYYFSLANFYKRK